MKDFNKKTVNRKFSLSDYDENWILKFVTIKDLILRVFGEKAIKIEHVGSTSIKGMVAKPLIDVLVIVEKLGYFEKEKVEMIEAGYQWCFHSNPDSLCFFRFSPDGEKLENIHMCEEGSPIVREFIVIRDYLRTHTEKAKEYAELKQRNIELYPNDYPAYRDAKTPFLENLKEEAYEWEKLKKVD